MDKTDVTIIIPVFNVEEYVADCIKSVMSQVDANKIAIECIVVDDRGSDKSIQVVVDTLKEYSGEVDFKIISREVNGGLSAARNSGIREARGEYIYLLDSDDVITRDSISSLWEHARQYPQAEIVCGDFQTFPEADIYKWMSIQGKQFPLFSDDIEWIRSIFLSTFPVISCNKLIRRDFILSYNLYFKEGILHEDNHWQAMAYHNVSALAFVNKVTYLYRMRQGSITNSLNVIENKLKNLRIIYGEMFSKEVEWDKGWAHWIFRSLEDLKFAKCYKSHKEKSIRIFKELTEVILKNKKAPLFMRLLFGYWGRFSHKGQERLFRIMFNSYWKLRKRVSFI